MNSFSFLCNTKVVLDEDVTSGLKAIKENLGVKKAFVVTDPILAELPSFAALKESIKDAGLDADYYTNVVPNPLDTSIADCAEHLLASDADFVIGFGGGSAIDTAKFAAIIKTNGGKLSDYYGVNNVPKPALPTVGIPTTAGAGAEVSEFIALTDTTMNTKAQVASANAAPKVALLCPSLLKGSPRSVTTTAGMDAIAHAVESYINNFANPITEAFSLQAFGLLTKNIYKFVNDTSDVEAASNMTIGATMACMAAGKVGCGNCHNVARSVQGTYHLNHGIAIGVALPHILDFSLEVATEKLANCARAMGIDTSGMTDMEAAQQCVLGIQKLRDDLEMPNNYKELGVEEEKFDEMINNSIMFSTHGSDNGTAPRKASYDDFKTLYYNTYNGVKITY